MLNSLLPWKRKEETPSSETGLASPPTGDLARLRDEFDALLERFWHTPSASSAHSDPWNIGWGCDLEDKETEVVVRAAAPGFDPEEIQVRLTGNRLVLEAEHKSKGEGNGGTYQYQRFFRTMTVPRGTQAEQIEAQYKNGVLEVHLPKGPEAQAKRIPVKAV